jgi:AcrR family transcriptional regulator
MPKAWNEREKELVRKAMYEEGRKLFEKYGLRKTTVDEIVRAARISKGSFYLFFDSKEELYFDILEKAELEFKEKLFSEVFTPGKTRRESFRRFLAQMFELLTTMPIYRQLSSSDYDYLLRKLPENALKKHMKHDQDETARYFQHWMEQGWMRKVDMAGLNGLLLSLIYFILHRDDFGEKNFTAARKLWIEMLTTYLVPEEEP